MLRSYDYVMQPQREAGRAALLGYHLGKGAVNMAKAVDPKEYATLFLARAIIEGNVKAAKAALDANANPAAFWIDGRTTLAKLAKKRGPAILAALFDPIALGRLPRLVGDEDGRELWTADFIQFAVRRGFSFWRRTTPRSGERGSELPDFESAKAAVRSITSTKHRLDDAHCDASSWTLRYDASWRNDKRIVGFEFGFNTSINGLDMARLYYEMKEAGKAADWPSDDAPEVQDQKEWEAQRMGWDLLYNYANPSFDKALAALRNGANPFAEEGFQGAQKGVPCVHYDDKQALALVNAIRTAVGPGPGWRARIKPLLTSDGVAALMERAELEAVVPPAKETPGDARVADVAPHPI